MEAVQAICTGLADGGRGQLRAACGTGKTKIALWSADELVADGGVVVVAVPTIGLVAQTLRVWTSHHPGLDALAVTGDRSVAGDRPGLPADIGMEPEDDGDAEDILDPVTTDPDVVAAWLRRGGRTGARLLVGTHRSCHILGEGLQKGHSVADLLVIDEAHRTAGASDKHSALLHDDDVVPARRRLYMTATPRIYTLSSSGDGLAEKSMSATALSMDNETLFGPTLYNYPFSQAIADGYLDDYRIAVIGVTEADVHAVLRRSLPRRGDAWAPSQLHTAMVQAAVARASAQFDLRSIIAFCTRVGDAKRFAETLPATVGALPRQHKPSRTLWADYVHSRMRQDRRDQVLGRLAHPPGDAWSVVSNARCLVEGVDVPAIDGIAFTNPKRSPVDIVQAVGRALRQHPDGSGVATIIVPILLPHGFTGTEEDIDAGAFDVLWEVVRGLRAHDDTFSTALDSYRAHGFRGEGVLDRVELSLPEQAHTPQFLEHLTIHLVKSATSRWWDDYRRLVLYQEQFGDTLVKHDHETPDGFRLGRWVSKQRSKLSQGRMPPDRAAALEAIGFVATVKDLHWQAMLDTLTAFHAQHGNLDVPPDLTSSFGSNVQAALRHYRTRYREGTMPPDRTAALDRLGMVWETRQDLVWQQMLDFLAAYRAEHGHIVVPQGPTVPAGVSVALFLGACRKRRAAGDLTEEQVRQLDELGMVWDARRCAWERQITSIRRYHTRHGTIDISAEQAEADPEANRIRRVLVHLSSARRSGTAPRHKIDDLDALGMRWDAAKLTWRDYFTEAVAYSRAHGNLDLGGDHVTRSGIALGAWVAKQKSRQLRGKLSAKRAGQLEELGITWWRASVYDQAWVDALAELDEHCRLTSVSAASIRSGDVTASGFAVGSWLRTQRQRWSQGSLADHRADELRARGVAASTPRAAKPRAAPRQPVDPWPRQSALLRTAFANPAADATAVPDQTVKRAEELLGRLRLQLRKGLLPPARAEAIEQILPDWEISFAATRRALAAARRYRAQEGHLLPPNGYVDDDEIALYAWLSRQRLCRSRGDMADALIAKLDELDMVWDIEQAMWDHGMAAAAEFHAEYGHLRVPGHWRYLNPRHEKRSLRDWVQDQRDQRRAGRLADQRAAALTAVGIDWNPEDRWDAKLTALRAFHDQHSHLRTPYHLRVNGIDIGLVLAQARRDHADGILAAERVAELGALGMVWDLKAEGRREMVEFLRAFHAEHGHIDVPRELRAPLTYTDEGIVARSPGVDVSRWLGVQRVKRADNQLTADQVAELDALGMVWRIPSRTDPHWDRLFAQAQAYYAEHGHLRVSNTDAINNAPIRLLYSWLRRLRGYRRDNKLSADRVAALDEIGMEWTEPDARHHAWMAKLDQATRYHTEHGHWPEFKPGGDAAVNSLGRWLRHQRELHSKGKLESSRADLLTQAGYPLRVRSDSPWSDAVARLAEYVATGGDPNTMQARYRSPDKFGLYYWLGRAVRSARAGELTAEQMADLVNLGVRIHR